MLQLSNLTIAYEGETVFSGINCSISGGERVALVGPNGAGKSSLLKLIAGEQLPTAGSVILAPGRTVAYLPQDSYVPPGRSLHDEMLSVFSDVLSIEERQRGLERRMSELQGEELELVLTEYARLQSEFDRLNGYVIEREVGTVLHGLGFTPNDTGREVSHFSGGWQSRIALGKILLKHPDLLLLDEPTNHLDLHATEWLEEYLSRYSGALLIVSHDRYFLERVTARTLELERGAVADYPGRYSWYIAEKERRREAQQDAYERQQKELGRQQEFIDRFRAKATKATAVKSREKMLDRIERVEAPPPDTRKVKFRFPYAGNSGREVLTLKGVRRAYGERTVLRELDLLIERGDKVAVVGPNGSGKSTLMRLLAGLDQPSSGSVHVGHNVRRSYYAQHQAELLDMSHTVFDEVTQHSPQGWTVTEIRSLLGRFLFTGDDHMKRIEVLSGGERSRVALVRMLLEPANTLLLDEPTNHLDIPTRDVLQDAIRDYEGTCIVISHDRYFLDRVATKTLEVENGEVTLYLGNYSEYRERKLNGYTTAVPAQKKVEARPGSRNGERDLRKVESDVEALEREIARSEERLAEVQAALSSPELYEDFERYGELLREYGELQGRLEDLNSRWEKSARQLEELQPRHPEAAAHTAQRERLAERLQELDRLLEDPEVFADTQRSSVLMDEYAEVYEALAGAQGSGQSPVGKPTRSVQPRERAGRAPAGPTPRRAATPVPPAELQQVQARIALVERMLMDPDLFLDEEACAPILDEYGKLKAQLETLTAGGSRS